MRTINLTIKIEDSDLEEYRLRSELEGLLGSAMVDIKTLPNTDHVKDDKVYMDMWKKKKAHERAMYQYIDYKR